MKKTTFIVLFVFAACGVLKAGETLSFNAIDDAYVDSLATTASTGQESSLHTQGLFDPIVNDILGIPIQSVQRTFLKFDISAIAAGSSIDSAYFGIYLNDSYQGAMNPSLELYYVSNDSWNEDGINWDNSQDMANSADLVRLAQPVDTNRYYEWNLLNGLGNNLDVASEFADDGIITMMIKTQYEGLNSTADLISDENGTLQPYLTVGYSNPVPAPGAISLAILGMGSVLATRKRNK